MARIDRRLPSGSLRHLLDSWRSRFWIVPAVSVVLSILLAIGLVVLDHSVGPINDGLLYPGSAGGARTLLSSIVTAMISVTGTVFSVSIVVLQLTTGQLSSRVVGMYLRDLVVQATLGLFLATFIYAMVVQRAVRGASGASAFVPRIAVTAALALVVASTAIFIRYISHIANMVRVATIVHAIAATSQRTLERRYPGQRAADRRTDVAARNEGHPVDGFPALAPVRRTVGGRKAGVVVSLNESRLVDLARESGACFEVTVRVGDFLPLGAPLLLVHRDVEQNDEDADRLDSLVARAVAIETERTTEQDLAFGFRQLVDIAERALSPSTNDPTTASQCLDVMHDLLRRLACRELSGGVWRDGDGTARLVVPQHAFADYLELALAEIWHYGSGAAQVPERIGSMLADLADLARGDDLDAVHAWQVKVSRSVSEPVALPARH